MFRAFIIVCFMLANSLLLQGQSTAQFTGRLQQKINNSTNTEQIEISILLSDRVDIRSLDQHLYKQSATLSQRADTVITALKQKAASTQGPLLEYLRSSDAVTQQSVKSFWVTNVVFCTATSEVIQALALRPDVHIIDLNVKLILDEYVVDPNGGTKKTVGGHEPGHDAIKAPTMWAKGYSGYGRKVMSLDTGVDPYHPAISNQFEGYYNGLLQSWFVLDRPPEMPTDCSGHGTHTVGTMCGLDTANNDTIGVAWGARWIGSPSLCGEGSSTDRNIGGFQWAMNPDGNASTIDDMPDVINNSWRDPNTVDQCSGLYKSTFDAVEAAGIAIVFSAGNGGSQDSTITLPKNINTDLVNVFCVANVNGNNPGYPISSSSSRGPSTCGGTGSLLIKPEVAAPGSLVRSCYQGDYSNLSGTSMAAPHVSGAIVLLKEAFPYLTGSEIKLGLYNSCNDLGDVGEDNTYGMGIIDVPAAFNYLVAQGNTPATPPVNDAALIAVLGIDDYTCSTKPALVLVIENRGSSTLVSSQIEYSFDQGSAMTASWTGSLAPLDTAHIKLSLFELTLGSHELSARLTLPNGVVDERTFNDAIRRIIEIPAFANVAPAHICVSGTKTLVAEAPATATVMWFDQPDSGNVIGTGPTYTTPNLTTKTVYYADVLDTVMVGKPDTAGDGDYTTTASRYLVFDCYNPFTLVSVKILAEAAGIGRFDLRDDQGSILDSVTLSFPLGESRVVLNFDVAVGSNYRLAISGGPKLFRNQEVLYPYRIPGVLSIETSDLGPKYYYYFYNWEVAFWSPCGVTEVPVYINQQLDAAVTYTPETFRISKDDMVSFQDVTPGAGSWLWEFGDGVSNTAQNTTHTYAGFPGTYKVDLLVVDTGSACKDSLSFFYDVSSGAEDAVFPNPSSGNFTIDMGIVKTEEVMVSLYDLAGGVLLDGWSFQASGTMLQVDLSSLADGTYVILVELSTGRISERLMKLSD